MKKGFTLIELLAVIVILAIIALIATPIVLGIIEDARESADKETINMYAKAVENAIARYSLLNPTDINITADEIKDYIEYDAKGNTVECNIIIKQDKTVVLNNCKINNKSVEYTYGITKTKCEIVEEATNTSYNAISVGDKVKCGSEYFYVMPDHQDAETGTVSLLAENNITLDAVPVQSSTVGILSFSEYEYWYDGWNFIYPSYTNFVYDSNSNLYTYVEAYKNYIISNGTNVIVATIPSYDQMIEVGCLSSGNDSYDPGTCLGAQEWVFSTNYWIGSVGSDGTPGYGGIWRVYTDGYFGWTEGSLYSYQVGIRPVIIVSASDIVF